MGIVVIGLMVMNLLDVRYNGGDYKEWFNTDVTISCDGYEISKHEEDSYSDSVTETNEGTTTETYDFRNTSTNEVESCDITIRIDKKAPKMELNTIKKKEENGTYDVILGASDNQSGVNRFKIMVQEKNSDDPKTPSKEYIFDSGIYVETSNEEELVSGATYTASGIEDEKNYMFWFAAVDRAGNISDVKGKQVRNESSEDEGSSGSSEQSSLAPAPSGIAGGSTVTTKSEKKEPVEKNVSVEEESSQNDEKDVSVQESDREDDRGNIESAKEETSGQDISALDETQTSYDPYEVPDSTYDNKESVTGGIDIKLGDIFKKLYRLFRKGIK